MPFIYLSHHSVQFLIDLRNVKIQLQILNFLRYLHQGEHIRRISLNGLYSHVVIHPLLHKRPLSKQLCIIRDIQSVESFQLRQMIQHKSLVIAQVTYRVLPIMRVTERQDHQLLQSVQIQNLLEIANPIPRQVQILQ